MTSPGARRAYRLFHAVLGLGLLAMSLLTFLHARDEHGGLGHLAFVAGLEALGAVFFLVPRTVRWGGAALLVVLIPGFVFNLVHGEWRLEVLIYVAGVWLVMNQGPAWGREPRVRPGSREPAGASQPPGLFGRVVRR